MSKEAWMICWKGLMWFVVATSALSLMGDPWLWQLTQHDELKSTIWLLGALILLELVERR